MAVMIEHVWASTYHAGSDCMIWRRFEGSFPAHVPPAYRRDRDDVPLGVVMFCDRENVDVCIDDELTGGPRLPRVGTTEAP